MKDDIQNKIILALDTSDERQTDFVLDELDGLLKTVKIGPIGYYRWGSALIQKVKERGLDLFIDFKFHDIPHTVAGAVESVMSWDIQMLTLHLMGGMEMARAAVLRAKDCSMDLKYHKPMLLGVSVLTSINEDTLKNDLKVSLSLQEYVVSLVELAKNAGLDGVVASGQEIEMIREKVGHQLKIVCPGIRAPGEEKSDQKRTLSAGEAVRRGADYLVIGRPFYESKQPRRVFEEMLAEMTHETR